MMPTESAGNPADHRIDGGAARASIGAAAFDATIELDLLEDAYYEVDLDGRMTRFNPAACRMLGYAPEHLLGLSHRDYMPAERLEQVEQLFRDVYETGLPSRGSDWIAIRSDGSPRRVEGSVSLIRDAGGRPTGFRGIMRDVTDRRLAEEALRESEARFRALTDLSSDWYWEQDAEFRFVRFEGRATGEFNPAPQILGRRLWELRDILLSDAEWDAHRAILARRESFREFEYAYLSRSGTRHDISVSGAPMFDAQGHFVGYRGASRSITARRREARLLALEHRVTHALAGAANERDALCTVMDAILETKGWDSAGWFEIVDASGAARMTLGWNGAGKPAAIAERDGRNLDLRIAPGGIVSRIADVGEPVWLPDATRTPGIDARWRESLQASAEHSVFALPIRVDGRSIGVFCFSSRKMHEPDARLLSTMRVISEQVAQYLRRVSTERTLRDSEARFRALTQLSTDWYWELDPELRFSRIGGEHGDLGHDQSGGSALGRHPWEIGLMLPPGKSWSDVRSTLSARQLFRDLLVFRHRRGGGVTWYAISGEPILDEAGGFAGYRGIGRDITDRMIAEQRIQRMATHDSLTGLPNRAHFHTLLEGALDRPAAPFAVMFIDLDGFKAVNDSFGHAAGDEVLRASADRIRNCLRDADVVARLGGDEFIVLARDIVSDAEIRRVADKTAMLLGQPIRIGAHEVRVTASIGIARHPEHADCAAGLVRAADLAMYEAKRAGKNRHALFSELQPGGGPGDEPASRISRGWAPV